MCDFDLSQALESSHELDETGFESGLDETGFDSHCFNMTDVQEKTFKLNEGLDLVVSRNPMTMQYVANLLLAANRMKRSLTSGGRQLSDDELCSVIMDSLVEETIIEKTDNSPMQVKKLFRRVSSTSSGQLFTLSDERQKNVVVHDSEEIVHCSAKLQAITLKGGSCKCKVNFKLSRYITSTVSADEGQAVLLSIPGDDKSKVHFSCSMKGDKAELNLEACSKDLKRINSDENMDRFLFYKRTTGMSVTTFESVKCRGWYISTYEDEDKPVEMCQEDSSQRYTNFSINNSTAKPPRDGVCCVPCACSANTQ